MRVIIPIRQTSLRLPMKHLYPLDGRRSMLEVLIERVRKFSPEVVLAIPHRTEPLYEAVVESLGVEVFRGDPADAYARCLSAAGGGEWALVWGDSPLVCPRMMRKMAALLTGNIRTVRMAGPSGMRVEMHSPLGDEALVLGNPYPDVKLSIDTFPDYLRIRRLIEEVGIKGTREDFIDAALRGHPDERERVIGRDVEEH